MNEVCTAPCASLKDAWEYYQHCKFDLEQATQELVKAATKEFGPVAEHMTPAEIARVAWRKQAGRMG